MMTGQTAEERRISPRIGFQGVVVLRNARQQIPCRALNLSETGMLVRPARRANPGSQFRVSFELPEAQGWVDLEGKLVHRTWIRRQMSWGIRFSGMPQVVRARLRRFVEAPPADARPSRSAGPVRPEPCLAADASDPEEQTRRVPAARLKQLAGEEDTRQISLDALARLMERSSSD